MTTSEGPLFSVIVPTLDRPERLVACLRALAGQTLDRDRFEVIVCDDGSVPAVAVQHADLLNALSPSLVIKVVRLERAGPAAARNLGAASARGRYLAFTDDDCQAIPDWLERLRTRFARSADILIGGGLRNGLSADACASATQAIMDFVYEERERRSGIRLFSTSNLSLPRADFLAIGGFSPKFRKAAGEDYDLCYRWHESGRQTLYAPEAAIVHHHALTFGAYLRQHFNYGRGLLRARSRRLARVHQGGGTGAGFYVRLVLHPVLRRPSPASLARSVLIGCSQVATVAGAAAAFALPRYRSVGAEASAPTKAN